MRFVGLVVGGGIAVGAFLVAFCAGLYILQDPGALSVIGSAHGDGHHLILGQKICDMFIFHKFSYGVLIVHKADIQGIGQHLSVTVIAFHGNHPVKSVDAKLQRRIDIDADGGSGDEIKIISAAQQQKNGDNGSGNHKPWPPAFLCQISFGLAF